MILHHFKANMPSFSVKFQSRPQNFAHTSATLKTQTQHFSI